MCLLFIHLITSGITFTYLAHVQLSAEDNATPQLEDVIVCMRDHPFHCDVVPHLLLTVWSHQGAYGTINK